MAFAEEDNTDIETVWYGDEVEVDIEAGTDGYNYMALFRKYVHGYEFGGHFMGDGEGPQTFVVIDTEAYDGTTWTPDGRYEFGESNYEVLYCCDVETIIVDGTYYKRMNLEDSEYYGESEAAKIRAIVTNSYPYVSLEQMKENLADDGFAYAEDLTRNEIIAAVQCAIWCCANDMEADDLRYAKSYCVSDNLQWGYPMHDTSAESGLDVSGKRVFETYPEVGERIDSLVDYLLDLKKVYADDNEVVITNLEIVDSVPVMAKEGVYTVALQVELNNSGSSKRDDIAITLYVDGEEAQTVDVKLGTEVYDLSVEVQAGQTITAVVSGTQVLPEGVYFYAPKPADVAPDKDTPADGIESAREVSQNLVGVAAGETTVYSEASTVLDIEEEDDAITADVNLLKTSMSGKALADAEFELFVAGEDATISVGTFEVDEDGKLTIENLLPGSYELEEISAPEGYVELDNNIEFVITEEGEMDLTKTKYASIKRDGTLQIKNKAEKSKTTPGNDPEEIEIPDEETPLDIPEVFGSDHFAYIIGRDDGLVHPEANITRAEVATIFFRLLAEEVRAALMTDVNGFSDVEKGQWYNHAISTLSTMGIVRGRDNGTYYDPDAFITRAEFAAIAARFDPTGNPEGDFFSDISGHWAEKEIIIAANNGWVEGYNGLFRPDDYITRAEAMTLVNRVLKRLPETEHDLLDYMVIWPDNMDTSAWFYLAVQEATNSHFYNRKPNPVYETWTEFRAPYDWSLLEY